MSKQVEFVATPGSHITDDQAQRYGRFLHDRAGLAHSPVGAEEVVELAKPQSSPIHEVFEWDDRVAGHAYRCVQARGLMRSISVVVDRRDGGSEKVRAFHHVKVQVVDRSEDCAEGYMSYRTVFVREELAEQVKARARREIQTWAERYRQYEELSEAVVRIAEAAEELLVA